MLAQLYKCTSRVMLASSLILAIAHVIMVALGKPVPAQTWTQVIMNDGAWVFLFAYLISNERKKP